MEKDSTIQNDWIHFACRGLHNQTVVYEILANIQHCTLIYHIRVDKCLTKQYLLKSLEQLIRHTKPGYRECLQFLGLLNCDRKCFTTRSFITVVFKYHLCWPFSIILKNLMISGSRDFPVDILTFKNMSTLYNFSHHQFKFILLVLKTFILLRISLTGTTESKSNLPNNKSPITWRFTTATIIKMDSKSNSKRK